MSFHLVNWFLLTGQSGHPHPVPVDLFVPGVHASLRPANGGRDGPPDHGLGDPSLFRRGLLEKQAKVVFEHTRYVFISRTYLNRCTRTQ